MTSPIDPEMAGSEWLETDGLGGFASGTVGGIRTRRYHALLLAATLPPARRMVLVNGFDAEVETAAGRFAITTQRYAPGIDHPDGITRLRAFDLEPWPQWTFELPGGNLTQELFVPHGIPAVVLLWKWTGDKTAPVRLHVRPFFSGRDFHATHHENPSFHHRSRCRSVCAEQLCLVLLAFRLPNKPGLVLVEQMQPKRTRL
jgi:predicted glycogen debranching enzyme